MPREKLKNLWTIDLDEQRFPTWIILLRGWDYTPEVLHRRFVCFKRSKANSEEPNDADATMWSNLFRSISIS